MNNTISFKAGVRAAQNGVNINNSYPYNHEEFVSGYKSIKIDAKEDLLLKSIAYQLAPEEYKKR